ncbi:MAG: response regulator [Pikeienuella sp.]
MADKVLLIEDDDALRVSLAQTIELAGLVPLPMSNYVQAKRNIRANFAGVILSDIRMPHQSGFDVLRTAQTTDADLPVILLTGHGDVPTATRAIKEGAWDFLEKPSSTEKLVEVLGRALAHRSLALKSRRIERALLRNDPAATHFPGTGPMTEGLRNALRTVAVSRSHVHIFGAVGVGRRQAAYVINRLSQDDPVLLRSDMADHGPRPDIEQRGRPIDLICRNMDHASPNALHDLQAFLATNTETRLVTVAQEPFNDLSCAEMLEDIIAPQTVTEVRVPTLDERREDLPEIFEMLLRQTARNLDADMPDIPDTLHVDINAKKWAGNLPELRVFASSFLLNGQVPIQETSKRTLAQQMDAFEKLVIINALKGAGGRVAKAADMLGLPRNTFYDRLSKHGILTSSFKNN